MHRLAIISLILLSTSTASAQLYPDYAQQRRQPPQLPSPAQQVTGNYYFPPPAENPAPPTPPAPQAPPVYKQPQDGEYGHSPINDLRQLNF